ncbi:MAG: hypothetical protein FWB86_13595 [Treponema sp.]|nr:hypothetical protein [Treponema sp.]MCL2252439.1 hypothetical protein [Treponema sp.]
MSSGMLGSRTNIPPDGRLSVGHEIEWTDIKDGEEKQVKRRLLPFGEYEITVFWHIQHQSGENFYTRYRVSVNNSRKELEVQVPYSVIRQMGL